MEIHLIWAQDMNGGIGKNGSLPWHISEDLKNFKKLTLNSTIIMGRKTWESLPVKPLPKRENIVLSGNSVSDVTCFQSIDHCIEYLNDNNIAKAFVIGGAQVYRNFIHRADELHITFVEKATEGIDTYFPVTLGTIMKEYEKIEEIPLTSSATYSRWVRK